MEMNVAHSEDFARSLLCRRRTGILVRSVRSHQIWSNGQTEIEITDLKLVKCQMYERARLDLRRAIPMPPCNHRLNCTSGSRILRGGRGGRSKGFYATTTAELAEEASVSVGQIYRLFTDKDDVFLAIVEENVRVRLAEKIGSASCGESVCQDV